MVNVDVQGGKDAAVLVVKVQVKAGQVAACHALSRYGILNRLSGMAWGSSGNGSAPSFDENKTLKDTRLIPMSELFIIFPIYREGHAPTVPSRTLFPLPFVDSCG